jgi:hypothetical protein
MNRRQMIRTLVGLGIACGPLPLPAQSPRRIGVLHRPDGCFIPNRPCADDFIGAIKELGYVEGRHYIYDFREWRSLAEIEDLVRDLVRQNVAVIIAAAPPSIIRAWVARCRGLHGKVVKVAFDDPKRPRPLFRTNRGRRPAYVTIYRAWVRAVADAGVEDCNLHDNRAFSATEAKRQGLDPQKLLGHDEARTTKIYLRDRMVEVVEGPTMRRTA